MILKRRPDVPAFQAITVRRVDGKPWISSSSILQGAGLTLPLDCLVGQMSMQLKIMVMRPAFTHESPRNQ
jgi:hypothetical protein